MLWGEWREGGEKRKKKLNQPVVYSYSASFIISLPDRVSPPHPFNIILFWVSFVVKPPKWRVWLQRGVLLVSGNVLDLFVLQALQVERICVSSCRSEVNYFSPFLKKKILMWFCAWNLQCFFGRRRRRSGCASASSHYCRQQVRITSPDSSTCCFWNTICDYVCMDNGDLIIGLILYKTCNILIKVFTYSSCSCFTCDRI